MKISFGSLTLGGGPNWFLDTNFPGHDVSTDRVSQKFPRSDFSKLISTYLSEKTRIYSGALVGNNANDVREKKRFLESLVQQSFTFTVTDDYTSSGYTSTYETYRFTGTIVAVEANADWRSNYVKWKIAIYCEDPLMYANSGISDSCDIAQRGFIFPLVFPFVFAGGDNTLVLNNSGLVDIYPLITLHGAGYNFEIINETSDLTNNIFLYTGTINNTESVIIDPNPTIKTVLKNGVNVAGNTNFNFEALKLKPGSNTLTFFLDGGQDGSTLATVAFNPAWKGI